MNYLTVVYDRKGIRYLSTGQKCKWQMDSDKYREDQHCRMAFSFFTRAATPPPPHILKLVLQPLELQVKVEMAGSLSVLAIQLNSQTL